MPLSPELFSKVNHIRYGQSPYSRNPPETDMNPSLPTDAPNTYSTPSLHLDTERNNIIHIHRTETNEAHNSICHSSFLCDAYLEQEIQICDNLTVERQACLVKPEQVDPETSEMLARDSEVEKRIFGGSLAASGLLLIRVRVSVNKRP